MTTLWNREPTMILSVISAGLALGMGFGLHISTEQMGLVMAFAAAVLGLINRSQVTPTSGATADDKVNPSRFLIWLLPLVLVGGLSVSACAPPPPNLTPAATVAYNQTRLEKALDVVRDTAQDGCNIPVPPVVACADAVRITQAHKSLVLVIESHDAGWQAQVRTTLDQLVANLPAATRTLLAPYVALVKTVMQEAFPS